MRPEFSFQPVKTIQWNNLRINHQFHQGNSGISAGQELLETHHFRLWLYCRHHPTLTHDYIYWCSIQKRHTWTSFAKNVLPVPMERDMAGIAAERKDSGRNCNLQVPTIRVLRPGRQRKPKGRVHRRPVYWRETIWNPGIANRYRMISPSRKWCVAVKIGMAIAKSFGHSDFIKVLVCHSTLEPVLNDISYRSGLCDTGLVKIYQVPASKEAGTTVAAL